MSEENKQNVLKTLSIDGLVERLDAEFNLTLEARDFYSKKAELLKKAIEKLKA